MAVLIAVVIAVVLWLAACAGPDAATSPGYVSGDGAVTEWNEGQRPGPLELAGTSFAGDEISLADYRGQVVVVTTWYAGCPPCRAEAPDLIALDAIDGVSVLGVNVRDDAGTAQAFQRSFGTTYPSLDGSDGTAVAAMQGLVAVRAVPTALVIDPEGRVAARAVGRIEPSTLLALVKKAGEGVVDVPGELPAVAGEDSAGDGGASDGGASDGGATAGASAP